MLGGPSGATPPRILIVDDDPNLLVLLADQLRADGYEIATARDGDEALRRLRASWPDLLIIDMMMPRMDGWEFCRQIEQDRTLRDIPVVVLSAVPRESLQLWSAAAVLSKPFDYDALIRTLRLMNTKSA